MSDPFGIVVGVVGIATAFSACIEVFEYVHLGRRFGKDYQTNQLKLTALRLRLSRWGEAVHVYDDPQLGSPAASKAELQAAKDTLLQIFVLFEDSNKISKKFGITGDAPPAPESNADMKGATILRLSSWAIHNNTSFKTLIDDIRALVDGLERLFPPPPAAQAQLAEQEAAEIRGEEEGQALATASEGLDEALHEAAAQVATKGHQYKNIDVEAGEDSAVLNGNVYASSYTGGTVPGASHLYDMIKLKGTKELRVLNGNRYGGDDFF
ncbi:prion-inhibition and propagation-domain-containing protein [Immersiella caudata]|uniref:Prion-inhibition and propagation-domain-containing protein n=1 Tax=Immersiella caudata TaxID=314043 RepID=A0AA39WW13_9PEZI|nr:prion-inhibition and propagation-domain-containing protein [Immersiella caudata]